MCHTLLQYYIHCQHSCVTFYPCTSYLRPKSNHSPIHPNYLRPRARDEDDIEIVREWVPSEFRDHSKPMGVAHSYHRLCPGCVGVKRRMVVGEEERQRRQYAREERARQVQEVDRLAVTNWRRSASSGMLAESDDGAFDEYNGPDGAEEGSGGENDDNEDGGVPIQDGSDLVRTRRNAVVGVIGDGRPGPSQGRQIENTSDQYLGMVFGPQMGNDLNSYNELGFTEWVRRHEEMRTALRGTQARMSPHPVNIYARASGTALGDGFEDDPAAIENFQYRWSDIQRREQRIDGWPEGSISDMIERLIPNRVLPRSSPLRQPLELAAEGNVTHQPADEVREPSLPAQGPGGIGRESQVTRFAASGHIQTSYRRYSTGAVNIPVGVVARANTENAARRWRWEREGRHRRGPRHPTPQLQPSGESQSDQARDGTTFVENHAGMSQNLMNATPVVASVSPALSSQGFGEPQIRVVEPIDVNLPQFSPLAPAQQRHIDLFMLPILLHQPDPSLDPTVNQVTGIAYNWIEDGSNDNYMASDIFHRIVSHHREAGEDLYPTTVLLARHILPWYRRQTRSEVEAANVAFRHLTVIGHWRDWYGQPPFNHLISRRNGETLNEVADIIIRWMARTVQDPLDDPFGPFLRPARALQNGAEAQLQVTGAGANRTRGMIPGSGRPIMVRALDSNGTRPDRASSQDNQDRTLLDISGTSADAAWARVGNNSSMLFGPSPERWRPDLTDRPANSRISGQEIATINQATFRIFWNLVTMRQYRHLEGQQDEIREILSTAEGRQLLEDIRVRTNSRGPLWQHDPSHLLTARRIQWPGRGNGQLEIIAPSGAILSISWDDLVDPRAPASRQLRIIDGISRLISGDLRGLQSALANRPGNGQVSGPSVTPHQNNSITERRMADSLLRAETKDTPEAVSQGLYDDADTSAGMGSNSEDSYQRYVSDSPTETDYVSALLLANELASQRVGPNNGERQGSDSRGYGTTSPHSRIPHTQHRQRIHVVRTTPSSPTEFESPAKDHASKQWAGAEAERQIRDCPDHTSGNNFEREWSHTRNDATHLHNAQHKKPGKKIARNSQHYGRAKSDDHGRRPYPHENSREHLIERTCEVLVYFAGCGHTNAVFVEKLSDDDNDNKVKGQCGCDDFDHCLTRHRKARSMQVCLVCQFDTLMRVESLEVEQIRQLTEWFDEHVRMVNDQRALALWPFGARSSEMVEERR